MELSRGNVTGSNWLNVQTRDYRGPRTTSLNRSDMPCVVRSGGYPLVQQTLEQSKILIIDDDRLKVELVTELLRRGGFSQFHGECDSNHAIQAFTRFGPDLVILDLHMGPKSGHQILRELRSNHSPNVYLPVLILTGDATREAKESVLGAGADDFLTRPFNSTEIVLRVRNLLRTRQLYLELENERSLLEQHVQERTKELTIAHTEMLERLAMVTEYRDDSTGGHIKRVSTVVTMLALELGVEPQEAELFGKAALLHDLGKVCIPDAILLNPGPLSQAEFEQMKTHTISGGEILKNSSSALLKVAERIARFHHERWNGNGYQGLTGKNIPLEARICAVADVFDALRLARPYKDGWNHESAVAEIARLSGSHFDPEVATAFMKIEQDLIPIYKFTQKRQAA